MCAGGPSANPAAAVRSVLPLIDSYYIVDTGIVPELRAELEQALEGVPGELVDEPFEGYEKSFTRALTQASGSADWLLHMHSDEQAEMRPLMRGWLKDEVGQAPQIDAYAVVIANEGFTHRLPRLLRATVDWRYVGNAHEYLEVDFGRVRPLDGLTLHHYGWSDPSKFEFVVDALKAGRARGDPRATFYTAEALRDLGRTEEAIQAYTERMMQGGWAEERWYAQYQAAKLSQDVEWLLRVYHLRPHRHEPLQAAARIVAARGTPDALFVEDVG